MTIGSRGQVSIPSRLRKVLSLRPGDKVSLELANGEIRLRPVKSIVEAGYGAVKPISRPEDFSKLRREFEEEMADEVALEG